MKRIRVPEFLKAAIRNSARFLDTGNQALCDEQVETVAQAVCRALSEHPQVPTDEQIGDMLRDLRRSVSGWDETSTYYRSRDLCVEWQRRCFVQEEPEIPAEIEDLLGEMKPPFPEGKYQWMPLEEISRRVSEAYRRGLRKGEQK